jgi:mRNA interferase MazF
MANPERGEVWLIDLGYAAKTRPGVVFSIAFLDQDRAVVTLVTHTTSTRGSRFEVEIPKPFLDQGAFDGQNIVTIPRVKVFKKLGKLTTEEFAKVEHAVRNWLGL